MQFQFDVSPTPTPTSPAKSGPTVPGEITPLLQQMLEVQREQLKYLQWIMAAQDSMARWRAFMDRWKEDFPRLPDACKESVPILERSYAQMIAELNNHLNESGPDPLDTDFALQEFLDRYGMRLAQLGTIVNLVAPLAEAGPAPE